ncbi:MAG: M13 family metallopeptidase [Bryobacterales bacterium]|nr:M13 family metallopeptidase [Bryobacterales bacterium]
MHKFVAILCVASASLAQQAGPGFSSQWLDKNTNPCTNFYQFACGNWIAANPLPAEYSRFTRFEELRRRNEILLQDILEQAASQSRKRSAIEQQIGDYYAACMDEEGIEKRGTAPVQKELSRVAKLNDMKSAAALIAELHMTGVGVLFRFGSSADYKNSSQNIATIYQGGLGLPDRDYYLKDDANTATLRAKYQQHMADMFNLLGYSKTRSEAEAKSILDLETAIARASIDRVTLRDPNKRYHKMSKADLRALAPTFDWATYFDRTGAPSFNELNVGMPDFIKGVDALLRERPLDQWKSYLSWHILHEAAPLLPRAFVLEDFRFYRQALQGTKEMQPRWRRCAQMVDRELGEALGRKFVEKAFPPEAKARMAGLVSALEKALARDIGSLDWMSAGTKKRALEKLNRIANKVGYPERWIDYSSVKITRNDALANSAEASRFAEHRDIAKIGKRVDPTEWSMTPPTVNAYYSPLQNNINFPAGILQPPFFDMKLDDAVNFGAIGAVIGHELTHGFDDSGRKFDGDGNLRDWWTDEDGKEFERRAECFVQQYGSYAPTAGETLNGKLTLGENVADNGGLRIAYMALIDTLAGKRSERIDGFTPEQRLFLGWAQVWCGNATAEEQRLRVRTDPHSPGEFRVNGTVSNMPEFRNAFSCQAGQPMVRENACRIW